jgi:peptidoglycan/LPS O-acetylase OafA/YrhL
LATFLSGAPLPSSLLDLYPLASVFLLLPHGCLFAAGIWLWFAANEQMTAPRWVGFAIALLASGAQVYTQSIQFLWSVPAATAQSPFAPLAVFLFAALMIVIFTQAGDLFSVGTARAKLFLRYLGLVTYPFYLIHNLVGAGISRLLIEAGLNSVLAVVLTLGGLLYICWLFCWVLEPIIRNLLLLGLGYFKRTIVRPRRAFAFLFMK